jgi:hypothetical protein
MHAPLYRKPRQPVNNGTKDSPPLPKPLLTNSAKSFVRPVSRALLAEESDKYARLVVRLNPQWRVIACSDDIQWILQARKGQRWRNRYFYRSQSGLVEGCHRYAGDIGGDALVVLLRLPRVFPEARP